MSKRIAVRTNAVILSLVTLFGTPGCGPTASQDAKSSGKSEQLVAKQAPKNDTDAKYARKSEQSVAKQAPENDTDALIESWKSFVDGAKARELAAAETWSKRMGGTSFSVDWNYDDVKNTDSLSNPVVGQVNILVHRSTDTGNRFESEYKLQFAPSDGGGGWRYVSGTHQRLEKGYRDPAPEAYPSLTHELVTLFSDN